MPDSKPLAMLKVAQLGLFATENDTVRPAESVAEGWKRYVLPAVTLAGGVPEIFTDPLDVPLPEA